MAKQHEAFDESIYDRIYQVVLSDSSGRVHVLHQAFKCDTTETESD